MSGSEVVGGAGLDTAVDAKLVEEARKNGITTLFCLEAYVLPREEWKQLIKKWADELIEEEKAALKRHRRKKLSCIYTREGRGRRLKNLEELLKENASLKKQVAALKEYIHTCPGSGDESESGAEVQTCLVPEGGEKTFCDAEVQTDEDASGLSLLAASAYGAASPPPLRDLTE